MMENSIVIFDTNAYRELVESKSTNEIIDMMKEIKDKESQNNITVALSTIVECELLVHLSDISDSGYYQCKNAILAMSHHFDYNKYILFNNIYSTILQYYFRIVTTSDQNFRDYCSGILYELRKDISDENITKFNFIKIKEALEANKEDFVSNIKNFVKYVDKNSIKEYTVFEHDKNEKKKFLQEVRSDIPKKQLAEMFLDKALKKTSLRLTEDEKTEIVDEMLINHETALNLCCIYIEKLTIPDFNMGKRKHKNAYSDIHICFSYIEDERLLYLITHDSAIIDAYNTSIHKKIHCITLADYKKKLNINKPF